MVTEELVAPVAANVTVSVKAVVDVEASAVVKVISPSAFVTSDDAAGLFLPEVVTVTI